ncbi:hypothetical protein [Hymenobacter sp. B81]|uniref:hypothetical protein n=1 Tax=Hymenobacter sp. B81 TaxID=3344878 RepID=UPI0037DDAA30
MNVLIKSKRPVVFRRLTPLDYDRLISHLESWISSKEERFGPHEFDYTSIKDFYAINEHIGYIAADVNTQKIIAYCVVCLGYSAHGAPCLRGNGLTLNRTKNWFPGSSAAIFKHKRGVGDALFRFALTDLQAHETTPLLLQGGTQESSDKAESYYKKYGFETLGCFDYDRRKYHMMLRLLQP